MDLPLKDNYDVSQLDLRLNIMVDIPHISNFTKTKFRYNRESCMVRHGAISCIKTKVYTKLFFLCHWLCPASSTGALIAFFAENTVTCMTRDVARGWTTNGKRGAPGRKCKKHGGRIYALC